MAIKRHFRLIEQEGRSALELKAPPAALVVASGALMWFVSAAAPAFDFVFPAGSVFAAIVGLAGVLTCLAGVASFKRAKTTVNPMKPDATSCLVVTGIYKYTRNPMYLGFLLILLGWAGILSNVMAPAVLPAFVWWMNRFQISAEERVLASHFGEDYGRYCATARRWL